MPKHTNKAIKEYTTKSGDKRYKFQAYIGTDPVTGKQHAVTRQGFTSYTLADQAYKKLRGQGTDKLPKGDNITFKQLYDLWWQSYLPTVRESTAEKTKEIFETHIIPVFGDNYVGKISHASLQTFVDSLPGKLVKFHYPINYLKRVFKYGVALRLIPSNPMDDSLIIPKRTNKPRRNTTTNFYNKEQLEQFLSAAAKVNERVYTYFLILSSTGLRKAEALALTWDDIDLDTQTISVNKTTALGLDNKLTVDDPKTYKGTRIVPFSDKLATQLKKYKLASTSRLLLFSTVNGSYVALSKPQQWLNQVYKKLPKEFKQITIHGFRHTYASLLFASDASIKPTDVQAMLGHETVEMTMDVYTHMTDESEERVRKTIKKMDI